MHDACRVQVAAFERISRCGSLKQATPRRRASGVLRARLEVDVEDALTSGRRRQRGRAKRVLGGEGATKRVLGGEGATKRVRIGAHAANSRDFKL